MKAYPIKFKPILKEKIWGGKKLKEKLGKSTLSDTVGESWEISGVKENTSIATNGIYKDKSLTDILKTYKSEFLGEQNFEIFGENFPLLIKFLDAKTNLSVQVHPDDSMAKEHHNSFGKTEMWYVMDSDDDAEIILGLNQSIHDVKVLDSVNEKNVTSIFNREKVQKGDSYFIPAGKIHAIGAGVLAAEIQQTSDVTYRVYDWDRKDKNGNKRTSNKSCHLVSCDFFTTNIIKVDKFIKKDYSSLDTFVVFMCVDGAANIIVDGNEETIKMGETVLIPANSEMVHIHSKSAKLLEVYIDNSMSNRKK